MQLSYSKYTPRTDDKQLARPRAHGPRPHSRLQPRRRRPHPRGTPPPRLALRPLTRPQLWSLRLSSLARLRLFNQTAAELNNLYAVLTSGSIPPAAREYLWQTLVPFELEVLHGKTRYWAGDHMAYVDELTALVARCKRKAREAGRARAGQRGKNRGAKGEREKARAGEQEREREMWKERGSRVCLILASQLVEMKVRVPWSWTIRNANRCPPL